MKKVTTVKTFDDAGVAAVFAAYPVQTKKKLMRLRQLIFDVAAETEGVGLLQETLKWGQPSYVTAQTGSGSTIRIGSMKSPGRYAMYFHCQTTLVDTFREIYRNTLKFEGNRGIVFDERDEIPEQELSHCVALALTYHLAKRT
jgi:Domain of unknown function (DU1801)